jgi:hypothetical protein
MKRASILFASLTFGLTSTAAAEDRWTCSVGEQLNDNLSASLHAVLADPGPTPRLIEFYVSWARQRGYMAEQQLVWVGIPARETRLWKPDRYYFGIMGDRTDGEGFLVFRSPTSGRTDRVSAGSMVRWLPDFQTNAVRVEDAGLRARLWGGANWNAELSDHEARPVGSTPILLPPEAVIQPIFGRMRAELERMMADPAQHCREVPQLTPEELEWNQIGWGTRIPRPNLESVEPIERLPDSDD